MTTVFETNLGDYPENHTHIQVWDDGVLNIQVSSNGRKSNGTHKLTSEELWSLGCALRAAANRVELKEGE